MNELATTGLVFRRGGATRSTYVFKHALVQDAAYNSLLISRRQQLHARIAQVIEERFPEYRGGRAGAARPPLRPGWPSGASRRVPRAGRAPSYRPVGRCRRRWLSSVWPSIGSKAYPARRRGCGGNLEFHLALGSGHVAVHGFAAPATGDAYRRASELCEELGESRELFPVLYGLCLYHLYGAELAEAKSTAERLLKLAERTDDRGLSFFAHRAAGVSALPAGDFPRARFHLEKALALYDPGRTQIAGLRIRL